MTAAAPAAPATELLPYAEMSQQLRAAYLAEHPDIVGWEQRDGGRSAIHGTKNYDGDAGARAITLAITGGENNPSKYKDIEKFIRHRMRQDPDINHRNKHSPWHIREEPLREMGMIRIYDWRKGDGKQPTITQALEKWGSGVAPIPRGKARLFGAAYIDAPTRTLYDVFDERTYTITKSGDYEESAARDHLEDGTALFHPEDFEQRERRVRFYYAYPQ